MPAPWENRSRPLGLINVASTRGVKRGEEIRPVHISLVMGSAIRSCGPSRAEFM